MNFLLKIVQGPNAGAEIALVEGMNLTFGCGDDCDIILSDTSVGEKAFELEVTGERVVAIMPGGKTVKLEPYHVTAVGASALAVGPQEGAWKNLVWPKADSEKPEAVPEAAPEEKEEERAGRRFPFGCAAVVLLLLAVCALAVFAWRKYPEETRDCSLKAWDWTKETWRTVSAKLAKDSPAVSAEPAETLDEVAAACGFSVSRRGEEVSARGDFGTRVERLEATAKAYAAHPGLKVDFADAESVSCAVRELLTLVSDGNIRLDRVEGRKAFLSGRVASRAALEKILRSLGEDVPKVEAADCSRVAVGAVAGAAADGEGAAGGEDGQGERPAPRRKWADGRRPEPKMPIAGVLTVPYPCLVLNDGTRVMEGARFGGYTIEKISTDRITVRGEDGPFEWRP